MNGSDNNTKSGNNSIQNRIQQLQQSQQQVTNGNKPPVVTRSSFSVKSRADMLKNSIPMSNGSPVVSRNIQQSSSSSPVSRPLPTRQQSQQNSGQQVPMAPTAPPAPTAPISMPKVTDARAKLLASIRQGKELKHVSQPVNEKNNSPQLQVKQQPVVVVNNSPQLQSDQKAIASEMQRIVQQKKVQNDKLGTKSSSLISANAVKNRAFDTEIQANQSSSPKIKEQVVLQQKAQSYPALKSLIEQQQQRVQQSFVPQQQPVVINRPPVYERFENQFPPEVRSVSIDRNTNNSYATAFIFVLVAVIVYLLLNSQRN